MRSCDLSHVTVFVGRIPFRPDLCANLLLKHKPSFISNAVLPLDTNADENKVWNTYGSEAIILSFESVDVSERICHNQVYLVSSLNLSKPRHGSSLKVSICKGCLDRANVKQKNRSYFNESQS
jgi:hypothetical protein